MVSLQTLGELRLLDADGAVRSSRRKELALLAYLARHSARPQPRAELAALLWGEREEERARQSLRQALLQLRRLLGGALRADAEQVVLAPHALELDVASFEAELAAGRWVAAVERWRGEFLATAEDVGGEAYRLWVAAERAALHRRLAWALEQLVAAAERQGQRGEAVRWALRWAEALPYDEAAHRCLLEALQHDGRGAEALARHAAFLARQRHELGVEPSPALRQAAERLEQQLRLELARLPSAGSVALFTPDLVGRDAEWAELRAAWRSACDGHPAIVLVEGEEGIGKTRLCEEFLQHLPEEDEPPLLLRARAYEADRATPHAAAAALLAPLRGAPGLGGAPDAALAELSRLVPALRNRFPALPPALGTEAALADAAARVLGDVAEELPIVLFLDDLPQADAASQRLLGTLAGRLGHARVLLLLSARVEGGPAAPVLGELRELRSVRRLVLQPLRRPEVEALLGSMLDLRPDERRRLARRLHAETGGNPFFVREVVSAMMDEGQLAPRAAGSGRLAHALGDGPLPLPATVREAIERRLARASPPARAVLGALATLERAADREQIGRRTALPDALLGDALGELLARRLVRETGSAPVRYELCHEAIRRAAAALPPPSPPPAPPAAPALAATRMRGTPRRAATGLALGGLLAFGLAGALWLRRPAPAPGASPAPSGAGAVLAVGAIADFSGADSTARALPDMLATNLARVPGLSVVSSSRVHELLARFGADESTPGPLARAARAGGAHELLQGSLHRGRRGGFRLALQRIDLRSGTVLQGYLIEGADLFALVDRATLLLGPPATGPPDTLRLAEATTRSLVAYRFYGEGLRAYYQGDAHAAERLFNAALAEDSSFALAAYYRALSLEELGRDGVNTALERAGRLAERASDRERLLIRSAWMEMMEEPSALALAETLAIRYPLEPAGHYFLGRARLSRGEFLQALPHLRRVIAMDSLSPPSAARRCLACDARLGIVQAYMRADSFAAAERSAREWTRRQPGSASAWHALAAVLEYQDRYAEALAARTRAAPLQPGHRMTTLYPALIAIRAGDFTRADGMLRERIRLGAPDERAEALWFLAISLRYQGRHREALETARALRHPRNRSPGPAMQPPYLAVHEAQILFEMGRFREAAALFDSLAAHFPTAEPQPRGIRNRRAWLLAHAATARAAAGDTTALPALAAELETLGRRTANARDRRLHLYVRGLLLAARGRDVEAADAFRRAAFTLTGAGFTRTNYELAQALLRMGRPRDALAVLRPALRGPLEASNLYLSRTELYELLGRAHQAAGQPDSAAHYYRRAAAAWQACDAPLRARRDSLRARVSALERR